ncbi:MAG: flavodoxin domain-containing protein [Methanomassiliicoccales archaeon]|nr:MAG: flavodoxin domain-containing protein [Methanomassiliicoccales archaeon]
MRVLLAFGTKYGSTEKVAIRMAEVMRSKGSEVVVMDLRQRRKVDLSEYDMVVLGSGIIVGSWTKEAKKFIEDHKKDLVRKKVALFVCCGNMLVDPSKESEYRKLYLEDIASKAGIDGPVPMGLFGGEIDFSKYSFLTKAVLSGVGAKKVWEEKGISLDRPYDFRDWPAIERWASSLVEGD